MDGVGRDVKCKNYLNGIPEGRKPRRRCDDDIKMECGSELAVVNKHGK